MKEKIISASLLSADFARLGEQATAVLSAGADWLHVDVMDNHYVPNLTFGPLVCRALRDYGITAPMDVHLMVKPVEALIESFAKAGATSMTFHPEACADVDRSLQRIRALGLQAGLAFNPATPLDSLENLLDKIDLVLLMSVNPGFAGQDFMEEVLPKIRAVRTLLDNASHPICLSVDGGIDANTAVEVINSGADALVSGSFIFGHEDYAQAIKTLRGE